LALWLLCVLATSSKCRSKIDDPEGAGASDKCDHKGGGKSEKSEKLWGYEGLVVAKGVLRLACRRAVLSSAIFDVYCWIIWPNDEMDFGFKALAAGHKNGWLTSTWTWKLKWTWTLVSIIKCDRQKPDQFKEMQVLYKIYM